MVCRGSAGLAVGSCSECIYGDRVRYFAFIRAINTGRRRLTNDLLVEPFLQLGFTGVAAYQAAGNIAFCSDDPEAVGVERLQATLSEAYGFEAPVFVRNHTELRAIDEARPFSDEELAATEGRVQVSFMHSPPKERTIAEVLALVPNGERAVFLNREWFWLPARGVSHSQLPVRTIEELVGPMTMRTLGTITRMLRRFD